MKKVQLGILLTVMMFGHNFVLNQTQTMQSELTTIHSISITEFNLLYSIPSAVSILFIIPMGFCYDNYANALLWGGAIVLSLGQLLVTVFASQNKPHYYDLLMSGRVLEGIGAEILYMIQGNMASSWMGKYAGVVFILPEVGEILNVFVTPWTFKKWGITWSFFIGFIACLASTVSCILIYYGLKKKKAKKSPSGQNIQELQSNEFSQNTPNSKQVKDGLESQESKMEVEGQQKMEVEGQQKMGEAKSIFQAGRVFWLVIVLCGVNECLYFPFLDNANEMIINRFCIPFQSTGYYLSIPFISAMITSAVSSKVLSMFERKKLIFFVSFIPLLGHSIIFFDQDCDKQPTFFGELTLILGFSFFGMGIGSYYSVSFPAVGLSVPQEIRGMAYACMAFFQTISMTVIPIFAGMIIESEEKIMKLSEGYKEESLLFVGVCVVGVLFSLWIMLVAKEDSFIYDDEEQVAGHLEEEENDEI